jgi:Cu/Ag efflux pump CusA
MTFKEMMAGVQLLGVAVVGGWLGWDALNGGAVGSTVDIAVKLLWAVGAMIAFNIVGTIIATIVISIIQRAELRDEPSDERDHLVSAKSLRNSAIATSIAAALALIPLAMGAEASFAVYALFAAPVIGGTINALSELYYYRTS